MRLRSALLVAAGVWTLDQITKAWVVAALPLGYRGGAVAGAFRLVHLRNRGIAFSMLDSSGRVVQIALLLVVVTVVAILSFQLARGRHDRWGGLELALVLGGALGNLTDRVLRGEVVDFLYFFVTVGGREHSWPAFNVADSAITVGAIVFVAAELLRPRGGGHVSDPR
jgi:signal peptidase II